MNSGRTEPIVLAHGICRFDAIANAALELDNRDDDRLHYFRGIRTILVDRGYTVFHANVRWAAGVEDRADDLRAELKRITDDFHRWPRVHVIAHSMGGLDTRHMIHRHGMAERVASLSTVGTPHRGSSFADWGIRNVGRLINLAGRIGLDIRGFRDLTRESCERFNERVRDFERECPVEFRTYAGVKDRDATYRPLRFSHRIIEREEGANDGLVSLESAAWRDDYFVRSIETDHLNEIGWWDPADAGIWRHLEEFEQRIQDFYLDVARAAVGPPPA